MKESNQQAVAMFHAYLDDQLSPNARAQFEHISDNNPALRKQIMQQLNIRQKIRARYLELPVETAAVGRLQALVAGYGASNDGEANKNAPSIEAAVATGAKRDEPVDDPHANKVSEILLEDRESNNVLDRFQHQASARLGPLLESMQPLFKTSARPLFRIGGVVIGLILIFSLGILFGGGSSSNRASSSDSSVLSAVELLALDAYRIYANDPDHAVEMSASPRANVVNWLSERMQGKAEPARLEREKYELLGGRLLASMRKPAAMYVYQDESHRRISLIMRHNPTSEDPNKIRCEERAELKLCRWSGKDYVYFFISDLSIRKLHNVALVAKRQLP